MNGAVTSKGRFGTGRTRLLPAWAPLTVLLLLALFASGCASAGEVPGPEQARLGNVFRTGELVMLHLSTPADRVDWRVSDFAGREVARGRASASWGVATIEPEIDQPGYYELAFAPPSEGDAGRRAFAVLAPRGAPVPAERSRFGVMAHFAQGWDRDLLPLIREAGIRHIRDEQYWDAVETKAGVFAFPKSFTAYMAEVGAAGLEPLIVMSFGNRNYDDGATPFTPGGRAGFARYGRALLEQYGPQLTMLEVWNEFNGSFVRGPADEDRPFHYARLLEQAYLEIKRTHPDVLVLGGAAVTIPLPWFRAIFEHGALDHLDGLVVHPYGASPEYVGREIEALRNLIKEHNDGVAKPIFVTEFGRREDSEVGRRETASYLVKMATAMLGSGVERMYWYLMRDYQAGGSNFESMGLIRSHDSPFGRYAPAPAYVAYATVIDQLEGATYVGREPTDPRTEIHLFEKNGEQIRVAWASAGTPRIHLETPATLSRVDLMGKAANLQPRAGEVSLLLSTTPVYLKGPVEALREWRPDVLLADTARDFGIVEAAGDWRYGHYDGDGVGAGDGLPPDGAQSDDDFEPLHPVSDLWREVWGDPALGPIRIDRSDQHPGARDGRPVWAVRRWVSPIEATVRVRGRVALVDPGGDGTAVRILQDGVPVFSRSLAATREEAASYDLTVDVMPGSKVDFALSPGPETRLDFDATVFEGSITLPVLADSARDFEAAQGIGGWFYGHFDGDGAGLISAEAGEAYGAADFEPLQDAPAGDTLSWRDPSLGPIAIDRLGAHPGWHDGRAVSAVRRWVSPRAGRVRIEGGLEVWRDEGDGTRARILVDGETVLQAHVGGADRPAGRDFEVETTVRQGSTVDFVLDPGPEDRIDFDGTGFSATIEQIR